MREILTVLAGLLIAVLVALLAVPPLVDWPAHRALVDRAIARAVGQEARTEGALDIRLLPSPRIRMARLRLGSPDVEAASLDAMYVRAEIALTPLLSGEVRFLDTRIGRAEIKLPTGAGGDWRVPRRLTADATLRRAWVFEDLAVQQFLVTTVDPSTGRTDQGYAESVRVQAGSLAGPWRLEGTAGQTPFEIALGEIGPDLSASLKLTAGGGGRPRLDVDGTLELVAGSGDALVPRMAGTARLSVSSLRGGLGPAEGQGPSGGSTARGSPGPARVPIQAQAAIRAAGRQVDLTGVTVEAGSGATALRVTGSGRLRTDDPRLSLTLAGRRFDLAGFAAQNWTALRSLATDPAGLALPVDLSLRLDSVAVGGDDDLTALSLTGSGSEDRLRIAAFEISGPGRSTLRGEGEIDLGSGGGSGRIAVESRESDRLARLVEALGLPEARVLFDGRPVEASADVAVSDPVISLRNLRVVQGETLLTGTLRHTAAEAGGRPRLDAQLALQGLDVAALPDGAILSGLVRDLDFGITLDARGVSYGPQTGGRISGRIATEGSAFLVEGLEIRDIAGAEANLSGRIAPDGTGRIEGRLTAPRAAPLLDLFGRAWLGGGVTLLPDVVRREPVDLAVKVERASGAGGPDAAIRTELKGRLAGAAFDSTTLSADGLVREIAATAATDRGDGWLEGAPAAGPQRPGRITLSARRDGADRLALEGEGEIAGVSGRTARPFVLGPGDDRIESGEAEIRSDDASAWLRRVGAAGPVPVPLNLRATLSRTDIARLALAGQVAGSDVAADLAMTASGQVAGSARLGRLSLPWLAGWLALGPSPAAPTGTIWPTARFGPRAAPPFDGTLRLEVGALDLGAGRTGRDASFTLATRPDGFRIGEAALALAAGRLSGSFTLDRQGGLASLIGEAAFAGGHLSDVLGPPFGAGGISLALRFGASGESLAGLVGNLGGAGEITLDGVRIEAADPGAPERVAARVLRSDDPLAQQRFLRLIADELGRAPLAAGRIAAAGSLVGGALRLGPIRIDQEPGLWLGAATLDFRTLTLDMRGTLAAKTAPRGWPGSPPAIGLGWSGPLARPVRTIDPAPLVNGLAGAVLTRELDRIETFELDAAERQRLNARTEMDRQRRLALEEAARQARLRQEAADRARDAERLRQEAERRRQEPERGSAPLDIRPPAQSGERRPDL